MGCDEGPDGTTETKRELTRRAMLGMTAAGVPALGALGVAAEPTTGTGQYLTVRPTGDGVARFEATAGETIETVDGDGATGLGRSVEDAVGDAPRRYRLVGGLSDVRVDGPAAVLLDGDRVA